MRKRKNGKNKSKGQWDPRDTLAYDSCEVKAAYDSKEDATQKGMKTYQCQFCGKWHKTSIKKRCTSTKKRG